MKRFKQEKCIKGQACISPLLRSICDSFDTSQIAGIIT